MIAAIEKMFERIASLLSVNKWRNILLIYWLVVPVLFYLYLFSFAFSHNTTMRDLLTQVPGIAIAFLLSCAFFLQAYVLYVLAFKLQDTNKALLNKYLIFSLVQQILTGNIPGLLIVLFYRSALKMNKTELPLKKSKKLTLEKTPETSPMVVYLFMGIIGFITVFVLVFTAVLRQK